MIKQLILCTLELCLLQQMTLRIRLSMLQPGESMFGVTQQDRSVFI